MTWKRLVTTFVLCGWPGTSHAKEHSFFRVPGLPSFDHPADERSRCETYGKRHSYR
jgi:hypothetical protein